MKKIVIIMIALLAVVSIDAQNKGNNKHRFSPEKFKADMEQFIVQEACLTPAESAKFFPVYDEMNKKQRAIFGRMRRLSKMKPADEEGCEKAIKQRDELDLDLKQLQQSYHNKFLNLIPASKLFDVLKAEDKFHRRMLNKYNRWQKQPNKK